MHGTKRLKASRFHIIIADFLENLEYIIPHNFPQRPMQKNVFLNGLNMMQFYWFRQNIKVMEDQLHTLVMIIRNFF